ncbi:hypothetical protein M413DRAFT_423451 [Hebeloma cylindrosporum]|uniref:Uncharacterized protein n=1 Tax=Hebeloma cylindrosporum TaxID=76867 RepID=A0A0C3C0S9_HEBCY|nr:hypothetical protein M413DRAFT_423451 [Hebeloma cylindrosporum h7]
MTKFEEPFPEDIVRIIVDELISARESLQNVALITPLFLYVCRTYIFRSLTINVNHINAVENLETLSTAISDSKRGAQLAISITSLQISDHEGAMPQLPHAEQEVPDLDIANAYIPVSIKFPLGNTTKHLEKILRRLTNIRHFALSFESWVVPYHRLSPAVQEILTRSTLQRLHLRGIEMLPETLSAQLLSVEDVSLSMCAFRECALIPVDRPRNINIRSLRFEPFGSARGRDTAKTARASPLHHWKAMGVDADALKLNKLTIILSSWVSILEAVPILDAFKDSVASLSSTSHSATDNIHNLYELLDKARPNADVEERFEDGWFTRAMSSLTTLVNKSFKNLRTLDFSVSYWPNMMESETNEELAWVCNILADAPSSIASAPEEIRIETHIRTLHCAENQDVALTLDEYEGWSVWNEELCNKKWVALKKVIFTISVRMVCCAEVKEAWSQVMTAIQNGPLADVNARGILEVGYAVSKQ